MLCRTTSCCLAVVVAVILAVVAKVARAQDSLLPEGAEFLEGDIIITSDSDRCRMSQMGHNVSLPEGGCDEEESSPLSSTQRGTLSFRYRGDYWLNNYDANYRRPSGRSGTYKIPYSFQSTYGGDRTKIGNALAALSAATDYAVTFVRRTNQVPYLRVIDGGGCWSYIGKRSSGTSQDLSLGNGCVRKRLIQHEFMHALGIFHEQSRLDRNSNVFIHFGNIKAGMESNFNTQRRIDSMGSGYDIKSIMHYGAKTFSRNGAPTITRRVNGCSPADIGTTKYKSIPDKCKYKTGKVLTDSDATRVQFMYGCGPRSTRPCEAVVTVEQTYSYSTGSWSSCSASCGGGTQTRSVTCEGSDKQVVADSLCSSDSKPSTSQACNTQACITYSYSTPGSWSSCSASCGGGTQTRSVTCESSDEESVSDSYCSGTKPSTSQACNTQECPTCNKRECERMIKRQVKKTMKACLKNGKTKKQCDTEKKRFKNGKCGNLRRRKKTCP